MNIRGGLSSPQDNGFWFMGSWIPSTPEKQIPARSNPPTDVRYEYPFGRENWQNMAGTSNIHSQVIQNNNMVAQHSNLAGNIDGSSVYYRDLNDTDQMVNHVKGSSFLALLQSEGPSWNNELEDFFTEKSDFGSSANRQFFPSSYSQGNRNFKDMDNMMLNQPRNVESLLEKSTAVPQLDGKIGHNLNKIMLLPRENHGSELLSSSQSSNLPYKYEFLNPCRPNYDRNLEQRLQVNATSSNANSVHVTPIALPSGKSGNQPLELLNFPIGELSSHEKKKQENVGKTREEETQQQCDGLLQNIVDSSSAAISSSYPERHNSYKGAEGIYLNQTPQQKTPKRRKHRPKVITEGKPKRTPKSSTTKQSTDKPSGKRKYVRRKGLNESATPSADATETKYTNNEPVAKSCKRVLKFDAGTTGNNSQGKQLDQETQEIGVIGIGVCGTSSTVQLGQHDNLQVESMSSRLLSQCNTLCCYDSQAETKTAANQLTSSLKHDSHVTRRSIEKEYSDPRQNRSQPGNSYMQQNFHVEAENQKAPSLEDNLDKSHFIARILERDNSDLCQNRSKPGNAYMQQNFHVGAMWRFFNQAYELQKKPTGTNLHYTQILPKLLPKPFETRVGKRDYPYSIGHADICPKNVPRSQLPCQEILQANEYPNGCNLCSSLNIQKKKKLANITCANSGYSSHKMKPIGANCLDWSEFSPENIQAKVTSGLNNDRNIKQMPLEQNFPKQPTELLLLAERTGKTSGLAKSHPSLTTIEKHNLLPPFSFRKSAIQGNEQAHFSRKASILKRKQDASLILSQSDSSATEKNKDNDFYYSFEHSTGKLTDAIIWKMKCLDLNETPNEGTQEQAIVPYNGLGAIVPSLVSDFIKKRKPRPKVDLDPDTERVWGLLMGKEGSESLETDKEKEKWWEDEREVFRGRASSFIARMHLVQGDRRFSQWKGSVVDSVVGVFLTQNVSDHLSSSAFMSLASRYPVKSNINSRTNEDGGSILIDEPYIGTFVSNDTTQCCQQVFDEQSFSKSQNSTQHRIDAPASEVAKGSIEVERQNVEEEVISSQDSDSSVTQYLGGIKSCSGSNSEAEDCPIGSKPIKNYGSDSTNSQMVSKTTFYSKFYGHVNGSSTLDEVSRHGNWQVVDRIQGAPSLEMDKVDAMHERPDLNTPPSNNDSQPMQAPVTPTNTLLLHTTPDSGNLEVDGCESFSEESTYSWPSISSEFTMAKDLNCLRFGELGKLIGRNTEPQNGLPCPQDTPSISIQSISEHTAQMSCFSTQSVVHKVQLPTSHQHQRNHNFQSKSTSFIKPSEASTDKHTCSGQSVHVPEHAEKNNKLGDIMPKENNQSQPVSSSFGQNSNEQTHSSQTNYERDAKISKTKQKKVGKEKNIAVDWDNLRKQVMANGVEKERSKKDAMDSLDYEAVRLANVSEIAETIKERGMNNLLAERIKEFLNRIVEDHGSIDLEWLRDVPPDKAKDYLLSIRGIGLKSVECVRLLTLRHLAFPVDTNVGRIAVRLGWVPLQPLPESLQLHLLEMYPMLESIQKFLWPRLCKLDQRMLYELHYQLITFGKVFCTKSKPNCNACPMRGECRHFASAFASARLALPGPEERGIVSSSNSIPAAIPPPVSITPMPLLLEAGSESRTCEPIIEEPLTPEQECTEICGSDIEDSFFEDPEDIPSIKLNIEELKTNLQNFIPEGDISKALVALNTAAASIPTPKLKNVSRLRTEHQVYELPDSHPLLEGMDKREPDDPSPYLLAIWKPGETADSFQQEEKSCESPDPDRLCDRKTCFPCNSIKEANSQTVRGTLLVPCRTAMRGSFPLNGTYFQVNEMFADHESSHNPITVPRVWIWNLPRRTVYFGTSVSTIFKGLSTEGIQYCFWRGFVCVRGFDQKTRAPRPLSMRLHFSASRLAKTKNEKKQ